MESPRDAVSSRFERELIDSVMRLGGQGAALTSFEVHDVIPGPADISLAMMLKTPVRNPPAACSG